MSTARRNPAVGWIALVVMAAMALTGCARAESAPADDVPALAALLDKVEAAVADGRFVVARRQLDDLVEATVDAVDDGRLDEDAADDILAAAAQVRALLPAELPDGTVTLEPKTQKEASAGGGGGGDGGRRSGGGDAKKGGGGKDRTPGKGHGPRGNSGKKGKGQR